MPEETAQPSEALPARHPLPPAASESSTPEADASVASPATGQGATAEVESLGTALQRVANLGREMTLDEKFQLCRAVGEECIQESELRTLLEKKPVITAYDGFEPSGRMHIAQGVLKALNVNALTRCGVTFKFWVADWHAQLNNKMGGDLKKIQTVGDYMVEIWRAAGMEGIGTKVEFLSASKEINARPDVYWQLVMDIARENNLKRILRCCTIMGRSESDELSAAQIMYPCMQCADIFFLGADICQLGMDQRKVNMLAREYCDAKKRRFKPVILSHPMMPGLLEGQEKMSKSDPNSAIFMEDTPQEVNSKIKKAFCAPQVIDGNPCLAYVKLIIIPYFGHFQLNRSEANGGNRTYSQFKELCAHYESGAVHPKDLKDSLAAALNTILAPVQKHFTTDPKAKELLKKVKSFKITR